MAVRGGSDIDEQSRASDKADFAEAVGPHISFLLRLAARFGPPDAADDVVQEALMRAWRHRRRFDPARGSFRAWLSKIVVNEASRLRRRPILANIAPSNNSGHSADERIDVEQAVRSLPPRQRLAVDVYYYAGLSVPDTAIVMGCSEGTVKATLAAARNNLRRALGEATK